MHNKHKIWQTYCHEEVLSHQRLFSHVAMLPKSKVKVKGQALASDSRSANFPIAVC